MADWVTELDKLSKKSWRRIRRKGNKCYQGTNRL